MLATVTQIGSQLGRVFERQQTEEKLRGSERQFRELLESSPIGVSIITRDDRLIFFNSRVMERTGYSAEELRNIHASDITKSSKNVKRFSKWQCGARRFETMKSNW